MFAKRLILRLIDTALVFPVASAALLLRFVRKTGVYNLRWCKWMLLQIGVFPIRDHYYEPFFNPKHLRHATDSVRTLPGIEWNEDQQLQLLNSFPKSSEFEKNVFGLIGGSQFTIDNVMFGRGDAEYFYGLLRTKKPARIMEIGSGVSTMIARRAIAMNQGENPDYVCEHTCIEPYEAEWLEQSGAKVIRERVELLDRDLFTALEDGDLLFIDSSHMIRPQGDVLCELLEILPSLAIGVIVHIHDIFSPRDYPRRWIVDEVRFWNEQYLLEAFLTCNHDWKIIGALNYLQHKHHEKLQEKCCFIKRTSEPGSFYIQRFS